MTNTIFAWSETSIARALAVQFFQRKHLVVVPNCNWTGHECDLLVVTPDLRIIDVEIKISRSDLKADAMKEKWWQQLSWQQKEAMGLSAGSRAWWQAKTPAEWPRKVWKHYYAMPRDVWREGLEAALPSPTSGLLLLSEQRVGDAVRRPSRLVVHCERRAYPNRDAEKISPAAAVDIARLASLRMWNAYEALERAA